MSETSSGEGSVVAKLYGTVGDWATHSRIRQSLGTLSGRLSVAAVESSAGSAVATVGDWVRTSRSYRWLTAEPDPDVIVIDLRETYTVGPIIRVLDRVVGSLADAWDGSAADAALSRVVDVPMRALGVVTLAALLTETVLTLALVDFTRSSLLVRAILFGFAALAIQIPLSASELAETRTGRLLRGILEPPEPPGEDADRPEKRPKNEEVDDLD